MEFIGITHRVVWTRIVLPSQVGSFAHQGKSLEAGLSTRGYSWVTFMKSSGNTMFLKGKEAT
jgi:hypothetical protein